MEESFYINNRFFINPVRNMVTDRDKDEENRIEPRLMSLLCLLAADPRRVVLRETLIKKIWDDYGGADEGLNQGISFLRKLLNDTDKKLIETVPKKGYILNADISRDSNPVPVDSQDVPTLPKKKPVHLLVMMAVLLAIVIVAVVMRNQPEQSVSPDVVNPQQVGDTQSVNSGADLRPDLQQKNDTAVGDSQPR
ncbi:MAG TPA: winged helix-turn-helix domain-containing protein [Chitinophagaceae bacterium]